MQILWALVHCASRVRKQPILFSAPTPQSCPRLPFVQEYADSLTSSDYAIGRLYLEITQGKYSKTVIKEKSPLDLLTTFGNIGGFWGTLRSRLGQIDR